MSKKNQIMGAPALTTGQIGEVLGIIIKASFIEHVLGIPPDHRTNVCCLWFEHRINHICYSLSQHIYTVGFEYSYKEELKQ